MKVLFAASEVNPFAKVGGLADVMGSLPAALKKNGVDARVIMPKYSVIAQQYKDRMEYVGYTFVSLGWRNQYAGLMRMNYNGVTVYFVDNEYYFHGGSVYGEMCAEAEKYAFFCKAVLALLPVMGFTPDILHCNDWQTGMIPVLLKREYAGLKIKSVMTIHNLKYQGTFSIDALKDYFGLPDSDFTAETLEFYGGASFLKGGLVFADKITTVSPTYAQETQTSYFGEKMDGILRARACDYYGILNGIDTEEFDPQNDPFTASPFCAENMEGKRVCKETLQREAGLAVDADVPLIGMVTRLYDQKGCAMLEEQLWELLSKEDFQLVVLGTGEKRYESLFRNAQRCYNTRVAALMRYDNAMAHRIYAGADFFLMPSLFEPCGLSQMIAMRYGTLPIVRETGGLKDTVESYNQYEQTGNGFSFSEANAYDMAFTVRMALRVYRDEKQAFDMLVRRAMKRDFSWGKSAAAYEELYRSLLKA